MVDKTCLLCGKNTQNYLEHLRLTHEIEGVAQFNEAVSKIEAEKERRMRFSKYVEEMLDKKAKGLITAEDYRRLVTEWSRDNA